MTGLSSGERRPEALVVIRASLVQNDEELIVTPGFPHPRE